LEKKRSVMVSKPRALTILLAALALTALAGTVVAEPAAPPPQRQAMAETPAAAQPAAAAAATAKAAAPKEAAPAKPPKEENSIVALVNDTPITHYELRQRMNLVFVTTALQRNEEMEKKVRTQVLEQLEKETIHRAEAAKNDITVSSVEVDHALQNILDENHMTQAQFKEIMGHGGVQIATFRSQMAASILWQKLVSQHFAGRIVVTPEAVDSEMARIKESEHKAHFMVSEIFLAVENPDQDEKIKKSAEDIWGQLQSGGQFPALARQFSQSPSAAEGGDIGVIFDGQLAPELNSALLTMKTGDLSKPIRSIGGYYILALRQRFEPAGTKIEEVQPSAATTPPVLPLGRLLLRLPPKPDKKYLDQVMGVANQIRQAVGSCEMAAKIPQSATGVLYFALGSVKLADLNAEARDALQKTESGGVAEPFQSQAGIEIFVRCDKKIVKKREWQTPERDQVENQLTNELFSALARRYDRDLRRDAHIEIR